MRLLSCYSCILVEQLFWELDRQDETEILDGGGRNWDDVQCECPWIWEAEIPLRKKIRRILAR